jgi:hypothetical protein
MANVVDEIRSGHIERCYPGAGEPSDDVYDRVACVDIKASPSEECGADVARPERVTVTAVRIAQPLHLAERVDGETARALEPALIAGPRESLEKRKAVA